MLVNAAISGASVHICHALATGRYGGQSMWADMLSMVEGINQQGVDVSLEQYPYPCENQNQRHLSLSTIRHLLCSELVPCISHSFGHFKCNWHCTGLLQTE
jgi:hypothetical protein